MITTYQHNADGYIFGSVSGATAPIGENVIESKNDIMNHVYDKVTKKAYELKRDINGDAVMKSGKPEKDMLKEKIVEKAEKDA